MQVVFLGRPLFAFSFWFKNPSQIPGDMRQVVTIGWAALGTSQVLADRVGSYGPANGYMAPTANAVVRCGPSGVSRELPELPGDCSRQGLGGFPLAWQQISHQIGRKALYCLARRLPPIIIRSRKTK
jgi:hypothetical protein